MAVKEHHRVYSDDSSSDPDAVDRAFEVACETFRQELESYLATTPRKPRSHRQQGRNGQHDGRQVQTEPARAIRRDADSARKRATFDAPHSSPTVSKRQRLILVQAGAHGSAYGSEDEQDETGGYEHRTSHASLLFGPPSSPIREEVEEDDSDSDSGDGGHERMVAFPLKHMMRQLDNNASDLSSSVSLTVPQSSTATNGSGKPAAAQSAAAFTHSSEVIKLSSHQYEPYFDFSDGRGAMNDARLRVELLYPDTSTHELFVMAVPVLRGPRQTLLTLQEYMPLHDLVHTIEMLCRHVLRPKLARAIAGNADAPLAELYVARAARDGERFVAALQRYTKLLLNARASGRVARRCPLVELPFELVCHITYQVYSRVVAPQVGALQQYKAFSNNVYGEIMAPLMREMIQRGGITRDSVFIDLGCGIGNVVLHVAAQTSCEAYGVEIMETPARLAQLQLKEFQERMRAYGFPRGRIKILQGDFLELDEVAQVLRRADVVLVNNYAFDAQLNHRLLQLFLDLKEGTRIISLRNFVPLDHKITVRNAGSAESILRIQSHTYPNGSVSWTNSGGQYFIHTVDRTAVQRFWQSLEKRARTSGQQSSL